MMVPVRQLDGSVEYIKKADLFSGGSVMPSDALAAKKYRDRGPRTDYASTIARDARIAARAASKRRKYEEKKNAQDRKLADRLERTAALKADKAAAGGGMSWANARRIAAYRAKEAKWKAKELKANLLTYRTMMEGSSPRTISMSSSSRSRAMTDLTTRSVPKMSLAMGRGGWAKQGFLGLGAIGGIAKWGLGKLRGGGNGNGGGPPMPPLPTPGGGFTGSRPGFDRGDFMNIITPGARFTAAQGVPGTRANGFHLNKSSYFLRSGEFVPAGTKWVKDRRRNSLNPRALTRALGRVKGAKNASKMLANVIIKDPCAAPRRRSAKAK